MNILVTVSKFAGNWHVYGWENVSKSEELAVFDSKAETLEYISRFSMTPILFGTGTIVYSVLEKLQYKQSQGKSLHDQFEDLFQLALQEGMYEAADVIKEIKERFLRNIAT